jgi:hypothetical protein
MTGAPEPTMLVVFDNRQCCLGHLLRRGREGWEAIDSHDTSLGVYPTKTEAAGALLTVGAWGAEP